MGARKRRPKRAKSKTVKPTVPKTRPVGRPRTKALTVLGEWLQRHGLSREEFAAKLTKARGGPPVARQTVDRLAHAARAPSLQLARLVEMVTNGDVPVSSWDDVPRHSRD